jgi:hypothetical protein
MAIEVPCYICESYLNAPGALLFGPPSKNRCTKAHLCGKHYYEVKKFMRRLKWERRLSETAQGQQVRVWVQLYRPNKFEKVTGTIHIDDSVGPPRRAVVEKLGNGSRRIWLDDVPWRHLAIE